MSPRDLGRLALVPFVVGLAWPPPAAASPSQDVCVIRDPAIVESSGLVVTDEWFVTVNDSGDEARLFLLDRESCDTVGVTTWAGGAFDVEAVAPAGPDAVWVGDIGDNLDQRSDVSVTRVPLQPGDREVAVETHNLVYPDGAKDAEALLVEPGGGRLVVITKNVLGGSVYVAPQDLGPEPVTLTLGATGLLPVVTDGAFFPDGKHLVVRNYRRAAIYTWPGLDKVGDFVLPNQPQGEGVATASDDSLLLSSEGTQQPVIEVELPARVRRTMGLPTTPTTSSPTPDSTPEGGEADADGDEGPDVVPWVIGGTTAVAVVAIGALWVRRGRRDDG